MKRKSLFLVPVLGLGLLLSSCGTGFTEIKDEAQKTAAINALSTATQYTDDYIDATFTLKVTAAILTINLKGVIQISGINSDNPQMLIQVEKSNGDKVFTSYYDGNGTTYQRSYDFTFLNQKIISASQQKSIGEVEMVDFLVPSNNFNFFEQFNINPALIQTVKQKKSGALTTYIVPITNTELDESFGEAGSMMEQIPNDATLFFGLTLDAQNKMVGFALEAKMKIESANVTLVFQLSLRRNGLTSIDPPFTADEMLNF